MSRKAPIAALLALLAACSPKPAEQAPATEGYRAESAGGREEAPASMPAAAPEPTGDLNTQGPAGASSFAADLPDDGRVLFDGDRSRSPLGPSAVSGGFGDNSRKWQALRGSLSASRTRGASYSQVPAPDADGSLRADGSVPAMPAGAAVNLTEYQKFQQSVYNTVYPVLTRMGWRARARRGGATTHTPYRITVHHTQGHQTHGVEQTAQELRNIQAFHQGPERGWADIGYHFLIDGDGLVAEGRPSNVLGAHAAEANNGNLGISLMGNFEVQQVPPRQMDSLERLTAFLAVKYGIDVRRRGYLEGHYHWGPTGCPGANLKARLNDLRAKVLEE
ncbi:MAG: N-acetylmuramoyl-L-alanine amidase, partial [Elusimicrobia bacterium]|nr:N-acetylmuramoyl-L-alanine amidase [Elusimicrobiota bacterium]